jgi:hypothetical protein
MKLLLAMPTAGQPAEPFLASLRTLQLPPNVTGFERITVSGNFVPGARELAMRRALALSADVLVMLDDDMVIPPDAIAGLCEALERDERCAVAGALYYSRDGLRPMTANHWSSRDTTLASIPAFAHEPVTVDAVGFGCVAIRVDAIRALVPPYVGTQVYIEEHAARVRICNEDYLFCERVRDAGYHVVLHAGVRCGHYDRGSGIIQPAAWEDASVTAHERMMVVEPGPRYRLVAYAPAEKRAREQHALAPLDYLFVD